MCGFTQGWEGKEDGGRNVKKIGRNTRCVVLYWEYRKGRKRRKRIEQNEGRKEGNKGRKKF